MCLSDIRMIRDIYNEEYVISRNEHTIKNLLQISSNCPNLLPEEYTPVVFTA